MNNIVAFPSRAPTPAQKPTKRRNLREDGRYCVRVTVRNPDGTKTQKPFYSTKSKADAQAQARAFREQLRDGLAAQDYDMTVSNWIDRWTAAHLVGKSVGHARSYKDLCTVLKERVGEMRIRDVKEIDLQPILSGYAGKSKSLLKKVRDTIRSVFTAAYRNGLIRTNPAAALVLPSGTYTGHRALEPWEVERS